ncbi:unnamed protein product, partial [Polarella glacialis]
CGIDPGDSDDEEDDEDDLPAYLLRYTIRTKNSGKPRWQLLNEDAKQRALRADYVFNKKQSWLQGTEAASVAAKGAFNFLKRSDQQPPVKPKPKGPKGPKELQNLGPGFLFPNAVYAQGSVSLSNSPTGGMMLTPFAGGDLGLGQGFGPQTPSGARPLLQSPIHRTASGGISFAQGPVTPSAVHQAQALRQRLIDGSAITGQGFAPPAPSSNTPLGSKSAAVHGLMPTQLVSPKAAAPQARPTYEDAPEAVQTTPLARNLSKALEALGTAPDLAPHLAKQRSSSENMLQP